MKVNIAPAIPLFLLSFAVSSCGATPSQPTTQATGSGATPSPSPPNQTTSSGTTLSTVGPSAHPPSSGENPPNSKSVPAESNVVVLTGNGLMPARPEVATITIYMVTNTSDKDLKVTSIKVINVVGSAFSLGATNCLNFILTPAAGDACSATVIDKPQAQADEGQLIVGMDDNTVKTAKLPLVKRPSVQNSPSPTPTVTPTPSTPLPTLTSGTKAP